MQTELQLTKQQRHEAYKYALDWLNKDHQAQYPMFICCYLNYWASDLLGKPIPFLNDLFTPEDFPEFSKHRPEGKKQDDPWFSSDDYEERFKILKQCIEETREVVNVG